MNIAVHDRSRAGVLAGRSYLGKGLYTLPEAARLLQVPSRRFQRWAEGYTFDLAGAARDVPPVLAPELPDLVECRVITFLDLVELKMVAMFRSMGISLRYLRSVSAWAAQRFGTDHPFATQTFHTDGIRLFVEHEEQVATREGLHGIRVLEEARKGQTVMDAIARPFFKTLDYADNRPARLWPLGRERPVVLDPARDFGKPIDAASGVPTYSLFRMCMGGESLDQVAAWYGVDRPAVEAAVEFESQLAEAA